MTFTDYLIELTRDLYYLDEVLVLGPYPTSGFIEDLCAHRPGQRFATPKSQLTVLADDGWDIEQLEKIEAAYTSFQRRRRPKVNTLFVASENSTGLVHAKIIYLVLKNEAENYTKRLLLIGSANASQQGFGVHAETHVHIDFADIEASQRRQIVAYISALKSGVKTSEIAISLGRGSWAQLPVIRPASKKLRSGFDAWLRQGRLCHKYQPDSSFGRLKLNLLESLPPRAFEGHFSEAGFGRETDAKSFTRPYVSLEESTESDSNAVWRDRYFVETYYGFWTSQECFKELHGEFVASKSAERESILHTIATATEANHIEWISEFESTLGDMAARLTSAETEFRVEQFFKTRNGVVDVQNYRAKALKRLSADSAQAKEPGFASRYVSGYSFERVPKMDESFECFAEDWCRSIVVKSNKTKNFNKIARSIRELVAEQAPEALESPRSLLEFLRADWTNIRANLTAFYK